MFTKKGVSAFIAAILICLLMSAPALAKGGNGGQDSGERPGWGYGDNNHIHTGPPGQDSGERPGWGYGDTNHDHSGPPGLMDKGIK